MVVASAGVRQSLGENGSREYSCKVNLRAEDCSVCVCCWHLLTAVKIWVSRIGLSELRVASDYNIIIARVLRLKLGS